MRGRGGHDESREQHGQHKMKSMLRRMLDLPLELVDRPEFDIRFPACG
jgi:hypothetical protein